jgi:sorting nexin-4
MDPFLVHLHSLLAYSHAHRAVLKLRDQKQLDLEELTEYLSGVTAERDRLSAIISGHAGSSGLGLSAYLRDKMDAIRGADDDRSRVEKMKKLDAKINEVSVALRFSTLLTSEVAERSCDNGPRNFRYLQQ